MLKLLLSTIILIKTLSITFPLTRTRQTCLYIKQQGLFQMQYIISGQQPTQYTCTISSNDQVIQTLTQVTEYESAITFNSSNNKICFSPLDTQMKQVTFDIISTMDPLAKHFSVKQEEETHMKMFAAFQELQKVYRDQNMFLERSAIYMNILANKEIKILFILIFKIGIAIILGGYQLLLIKDIISNKTYGYSLPQGVQQEDSEDEMD